VGWCQNQSRVTRVHAPRQVDRYASVGTGKHALPPNATGREEVELVRRTHTRALGSLSFPLSISHREPRMEGAGGTRMTVISAPWKKNHFPVTLSSVTALAFSLSDLDLTVI
jgi:hypothetical protein